MATVQAYWLPKRGYQVDEYEDAWAANAELGRFAIADGATESSFAGDWARLLAADFVAQGDSELAAWLDGLPRIGAEWWSRVGSLALPWYADWKREEGAFATFLGLVVSKSHSWRALAVGDSCLFHVRGGTVLSSFPIAAPEDFSVTPWLLGSRRQLTEEWRQQAVKTVEGNRSPGDEFWLLTDAVACWLLAALQTDPARPAALPFEATPAGFETWVQAERETGRMRNDDCTWLVIRTE